MMELESVRWSQIQSAIDRLRSGHRVRWLTNLYAELQDITKFAMLTSDRAIVFVGDEGGFARLYYHAVDVESMKALLENIQYKIPLVIGYLDKNRNEALCAAFRNAGFKEIAHYRRMTNAGFPTLASESQPQFAKPEEAQTIFSMMRDTFNAMTDHLPSREKLRSLIEHQQVIVRREADEITGFVVFQIFGRQVNFNYLLNRGSRGNGTILMQDFHQCMASRGLNSGFLWVESTNERARKIYDASGWKVDGLNDWFFLR